MPRIQWDNDGERFYEAGVDQGVLYPSTSGGAYSAGVAWNGLVNVNEQPSGAEPNKKYADSIEYLNLMSAEEFAATIEAYTYPDEFKECNGEAELVPGMSIGQQTRKKFGFAYRTKVGNDVDGIDHGYKLHLVYGCTAAPSEKSYATLNESPDATTMSWTISTTPVKVTGFKPTAIVTVDSRTTPAGKMKALEEVLYGKENTPANLPLPDAVKAILEA